jgi:threonine/homoserine/homoserine lactone efflux protein
MVAVPDSHALALFAAAALALLLVPGPAVLYVVAQSAEHGRLAGIVSVAGVHLGTLVHVAAATVGLSALIVSSAIAFSVVKYAGAAYLVYLGIRRLLTREPAELLPARDESLSRLFVEGAVVNVLNPKTALFSSRSCRSSSTPNAASGRRFSRSASRSWSSASSATGCTRSSRGRSPAG